MSIVLQNQSVKLELSSETGAILGLYHIKTDWQAIGCRELGEGMRLLVPFGRHRNNRVLSSAQRPAEILSQDETHAVFFWEKVTGTHSGELNISVRLAVSLEGEAVSFKMELDNRSPLYIEEAWCPCLNGLKEKPGEEPLSSMTVGMCCDMTKHTLGDGFPQQCGYWGTDYPAFLHTYPGPESIAPFNLVTNGKQGIYLGVHDREVNVINFVHELKPGYADSIRSGVPAEEKISGIPAGVCLGVARMPYVMAGEKAALPPVTLRFFEGDWHEGVKPYKEWRDSWFQRVSKPKWADDMDCWMTLHINSPEGCCRHRYTELPAIAREAKEHGVQALQLIGWAIGGQDGNEPFQDTDPMLGTREELRDAIAEIEKMGVHVLLMCKFKWADWEVPEFEEKAEKFALTDIYGRPYQFGGYAYQTLANQLGGSLRSGVGLCHQSEEFRRFARGEFAKILDLSPSGILYDELANHMRLCYSPNHSHRFGACNHEGSVKLAEEFYEDAVKHNPDFLMTGEGPLDVFTRYYTVNYIRSATLSHEPVHKFMDPSMRFATCLTGFDDREMVNQCLTYGYIINYEPYNFKGRVTDYPKTIAYGEKALALRRRLREYLWDGTFTHTLGAEVTADSTNSEWIYSVFKNEKGSAVVVANQNRSLPLTVSVSVVGCSSFSVYSVESEEVIQSSGSITVPPRSLAVLVDMA